MALPLWTWFIGAVAAAAGAAVALTLVIAHPTQAPNGQTPGPTGGRLSPGSDHGAALEASASALARAPAGSQSAQTLTGSTSSPPGPTNVAARAGEPASIRELLIAADARAEVERLKARMLKKRLENSAELINEPTVIEELREQIENPNTAREALSTMASSVSGHVGADMLHEIATRTTARADVAELARSLLRARDVRAKASPALSILMALEDAETCEQYKELLPAAVADADKRVLPIVNKLKRKQGCGANKRQDCYGCLRAREEREQLESIPTATKNRREPPLVFGKP